MDATNETEQLWEQLAEWESFLEALGSLGVETDKVTS